MDDPKVVFSAPEKLEATLAEMKALGADRIRVSVFWHLLAPEPDSETRPFGEGGGADPRNYSAEKWDRYDRILTTAQSLGLKVLFNLTSPAPNWATPSPPRADLEDSYRPSAAEFRDFVKAVGARYSGTFADEAVRQNVTSLFDDCKPTPNFPVPPPICPPHLRPVPGQPEPAEHRPAPPASRHLVDLERAEHARLADAAVRRGGQRASGLAARLSRPGRRDVHRPPGVRARERHDPARRDRAARSKRARRNAIAAAAALHSRALLPGRQLRAVHGRCGVAARLPRRRRGLRGRASSAVLVYRVRAPSLRVRGAAWPHRQDKGPRRDRRPRPPDPTLDRALAKHGSQKRYKVWLTEYGYQTDPPIPTSAGRGRPRRASSRTPNGSLTAARGCARPHSSCSTTTRPGATSPRTTRATGARSRRGCGPPTGRRSPPTPATSERSTCRVACAGGSACGSSASTARRPRRSRPTSSSGERAGAGGRSPRRAPRRVASSSFAARHATTALSGSASTSATTRQDARG